MNDREAARLFELDGIIRTPSRLRDELAYRPPRVISSQIQSIDSLDRLATQPDPRFLTLRSKGPDHERLPRVRR